MGSGDGARMACLPSVYVGSDDGALITCLPSICVGSEDGAQITCLPSIYVGSGICVPDLVLPRQSLHQLRRSSPQPPLRNLKD